MIKQRYPLALAETVATSLITHLVDACERVQVAGSIRRRRQDVGDIEMLYVPLQDQKDLWGNLLPVPQNKSISGASAIVPKCHPRSMSPRGNAGDAQYSTTLFPTKEVTCYG